MLPIKRAVTFVSNYPSDLWNLRPCLPRDTRSCCVRPKNVVSSTSSKFVWI